MTNTNTNAYRRYALVVTFTNSSSMEELGKKICNNFKKSNIDVKLTTVREKEIEIRYPRNTVLSKREVEQVIAKSVKSIIEDIGESFSDHISEVYEFEYDPKFIDEEFVDKAFSVNVTGKFIYIEIDD